MERSGAPARELDPATNEDSWRRGWRGAVHKCTYLDPAAQEAVAVEVADILSRQEERSA
jgi:hypothetical protein